MIIEYRDHVMERFIRHRYSFSFDPQTSKINTAVCNKLLQRGYFSCCVLRHWTQLVYMVLLTANNTRYHPMQLS